MSFKTPIKVQFKELPVIIYVSRDTAVAAGVIYGDLSGFRLFRAFTSKRYIIVYNAEPENHFHPMKHQTIF